jgi:hypothetical protein
VKKENNTRRYSGKQPCHLSKLRITEAEDRKKDYDGLSLEQKIEALDTKLGKGVGAKKQRARLAKAIEDRNNPNANLHKGSSVQSFFESTGEVKEVEELAQKKQKHLKAKDRRKQEQRHNEEDR